MKIVMANGCFDLLHPGHKAHLQQARDMGDFLIVALTLDKYVNKGPHRPIYQWEERADLLRGLRCVDKVVPSATCADAVLAWRPDIFVKGADYTLQQMNDDVRAACAQVGAEIRFTTTPKLSATEAIRKAMA